MSDINIQTKLIVEEDVWPPVPPKSFTPLVLIRYLDDHNLKQFTAMAEFVEQRHVSKLASVASTESDEPFKHLRLSNHNHPLEGVLDSSKITKEIAEILAPMEASVDPQFILIEGAPGIGKSFLLKEIAYRWGAKQILQKFKLVLLVCLRDPAVQQMSHLDDLLLSFCRGDRKANKLVSACSEYLLENSGCDLVFLFDGYDEFPEKLRKDSLIACIINRRVLPNCSLIISSRPHASLKLRNRTAFRVEILGFTREEREHYIKESLNGKPQKIAELTQYLQGHRTISSLCFVPFNMVILVYLYKEGVPLPKGSAELYDYFICLTVCRQLAKHGEQLQSSIIKLNDLSEPYNKIIQQLSKLSLEALNDKKLIFSLDEIEAVCKDITTFPKAINGFGLLQAVEHLGLTETTKTFHFLHFSIQEYLAAHYVANLPADEELKIIETYFWSDTHFNMFSMYLSLTKGQKPSFKKFLFNEYCFRKLLYDCETHYTLIDNKSWEFYSKYTNLFRLYHCFYESGDVDTCKTIEKRIKNITFTEIYSFSVVELECIAVFLSTSSHKVWCNIVFQGCYIQDHGFHILHHGLLHSSDVTISTLSLRCNGLRVQSSSLISDIAVKCKVKELDITGNYSIGEDKQLYQMLANPFSTLEKLNMYDTKLSSKGAIELFKALVDNSSLKVLYIHGNYIMDDACDAITIALKRNRCLVSLNMNDNPLTGKIIVEIVNSLIDNYTLISLSLPECPRGIKEHIGSLQEIINDKRKQQRFQDKLMIDYW